MEDAGRGRRCRPGDRQRWIRAVGVARWRLRLLRGDYRPVKSGIYYIDRLSGDTGIHYFDRPSGETRLQYFDFATQKSTTVARDLGNVDLPLTASSDGRTILYHRQDSAVNDLMLVENFR